jgi:hypothetical protein
MNSKNTILSFSPLFKTYFIFLFRDSILLSNENKLAKVKDDKNGKVILLNLKAIDIKKLPIKFKILSIATTMHIGLCIKSNIQQKAYKFDKNISHIDSALDHGFFIGSSNGFVYSSNDPTANNKKGNLLFKGGD